MFRLGVLVFLSGILIALAINSLSYWWYLLPSIILMLAVFSRHKKIIYSAIFFAAGFCWLLLTLENYANWQLPKSLEKQPVTIYSTISSIPEYQDHVLSFIVKADQLADQKNLHLKLKLDWYFYHGTPPEIKPGQQWQFIVKLKRPHSLMNPGSFDYVEWMVQEHIQADGYIVSAQQLSSSHWRELNGQIRNHIKNNLKKILGDRYLANFIAALTIGVRENISVDQWQVLQNTGTNHLIAIAGLHIGFITALLFFITSFIWKRIPRLALFIATPRVAATVALLAAWCYAALAGFSLPTERAVVMLTVFMMCIIMREIILPWSAWCLALFIVLILNPLTVLSAAFWLSFIAVALIIFTVSGRVGSVNRWWRLTKVQFALALGLLPITLLFFHNGSLVAPIANVITIPIVGFLTVPLSLLGVVISLFSVALAKPILLAALATMEIAWKILTYLAYQPGANYPVSITTWQAVSISLGVFLLLLPRGIPGKLLSIIFFLPLFFPMNINPPYGQVWLTVLDVGQGLSAVVRTQHHVLIYDTGASYGENYDMGKAVVVPYLQYYHINSVNTIIISHGDNDHLGGLNSILQVYTPQNILTSVPNKIKTSTECLAGQEWQWDGVDFEILYPDATHLGLDNNSSCILRISTRGKHILLTGDIEKLAEDYLVEHNADELSANILVAPHHGSKTSSTIDFLNNVKPDFVVFPTGYLNRFDFPNQSTAQRYAALGATMYNTATGGAISFMIDPKEKISLPSMYCYSMKLTYFRYCVSISAL